MTASTAAAFNLTYDAGAPWVLRESGFAARRAGDNRARRAPVPDNGSGWNGASDKRSPLSRVAAPTATHLGHSASLGTKLIRDTGNEKARCANTGLLLSSSVVWRCVEAPLMSASRLDRRQTA
jgi:hypothetical protein